MSSNPKNSLLPFFVILSLLTFLCLCFPYDSVILHQAQQTDQLADFFKDIQEGFALDVKSIPSKYIYDAEGSRLFTQLTQTPQYYIWRCENEIITNHASQILEIMGRQHFNLVDLGAGDATKTMILLQEAIEIGYDFEYIPLDISHQSNLELAANLQRKFPTLKVTLMTSTFNEGVKWVVDNKNGRNVFILLGTTLGNIQSMETLKSIIKFYGQIIKEGDLFVVGLDKFKDPFVIQQAYSNEKRPLKGIAMNLIERINRQLQGNLNPNNFYEHSYYDPLQRKLRAGIVSKSKQQIVINGKEFNLGESEFIEYLISRKWLLEEAVQLFQEFGFKSVASFEDENGYFVQLYFQKLRANDEL